MIKPKIHIEVKADDLFGDLCFLLEGYQAHFSLSDDVSRWRLTPEDAYFLTPEYDHEVVERIAKRLARHSLIIQSWLLRQEASTLSAFARGMVLMCLIADGYKQAFTNMLTVALDKLHREQPELSAVLASQVSQTIQHVRLNSRLLRQHSELSSYQYNSDLFDLNRKLSKAYDKAELDAQQREQQIEQDENAKRNIPIAIHRDVGNLPHHIEKVVVLDWPLIKNFERHAKLSRRKKVKRAVQELKNKFLENY